MIVCAGRTEYFSFAHPIGVGLIEAAMNLTQMALFDKPEFLLFVGTAGSFGEHEIFDIIESRGASQIEHCFWKKGCYTPLDNVITSEGLNVSHETLINSSNYITTDPSLWPYFTKQGIHAENMEFFSLLQVAKEHNIPAGGIFIITNHCNKKAHEAYKTNLKEALQRLERYVREKFSL
ncbi:MAG: purine-nucleoside phosphorylase [Epsilonproteobacteria bacterium]|nr:purine-nucleoside phosphorylase [Campylobacterota bacterium]NPA63528.1 purine-nucleoside phosphorylase [Campylobacterota bacterium]